MHVQKLGSKRKKIARFAEHQQHAVIILLFCQQHPKREQETNQTAQANAASKNKNNKNYIYPLPSIRGFLVCENLHVLWKCERYVRSPVPGFLFLPWI